MTTPDAGQLPMLPVPEILAPDLLPPTTTPRSPGLERARRRQMDEVASRAQLAHTTEQARAFLAASAIGNLTTLAALTEASCQSAPAATSYYHAILRAYGISAARSISTF